MATVERRVVRAARVLGRSLAEVGEELRRARLAAGLSQAAVGAAAGISHAEVGRIERGVAPWVSLAVLGRVASVVGLELSVRVFPAGGPIRDDAHIALLESLRTCLAPGLIWRSEVPVTGPGDLRAWDRMILNAGPPIAVEGETRVRDWQALERRLALKQRDGGLERVVLLLSDTRSNREAVRVAGPALRVRFPVSGEEALRALRAGRDPGGSAIIFRRVSRSLGTA